MTDAAHRRSSVAVNPAITGASVRMFSSFEKGVQSLAMFWHAYRGSASDLASASTVRGMKHYVGILQFA